MRSLNARGHASKKVPNSPILINYHKLDNIKVNKGQIHIELRNFLGTS